MHTRIETHSSVTFDYTISQPRAPLNQSAEQRQNGCSDQTPPSQKLPLMGYGKMPGINAILLSGAGVLAHIVPEPGKESAL